ncbi:MAG: hypothetical protein A2010_15450 [Nitrospirae bacterium GWD2_57_9]|nr:MAG: hypothetical protein A2010_15450 [Nitrospirae bacterium GWD2_57_9]
MRTTEKDRAKSAFVIAMAALLTVMTLSLADGKTAARSDKEKKLSTEIMLLNNDANMPEGDRIASDQLAKEFDVSHDRIKALRGQNLDYGEIAAVLGIADKMSGGVNDANISRIVDLRKTAAGWPQVAANLDVDAGDLANRVSRIEDGVHRELKGAPAGSSSSGGAAGGTASTTNERDVGTAGADY